jgi:predicted enzyme related to lactoylglutathione lyase
LETSVDRAKELGATIHKEITTIQMGKFAILADPQGAVIGLWQFTS